jgi:hypothetical protein
MALSGNSVLREAVMFFPIFTDRVTRKQHLAWNLVVRRLQEHDDNGTGKGWLFHGTDHVRATHILDKGFNFEFEKGESMPVFWGTANIAAGFAEKKAEADSPPVLIAARTVDVLASGQAMVDETALDTGCESRGPAFLDPSIRHNLEISTPKDWQESYLATGCLMVRNGTRVQNLKLFGISNMPLHPDAPESRQNRIDWDFTLKPHPRESLRLITEVNADLFPKGWNDHKNWIAEIPKIEAIEADPDAEAERRGFSIPPISPA